MFVESICRRLEVFLGSGGDTSKLLSKIRCIEWRRKHRLHLEECLLSVP